MWDAVYKTSKITSNSILGWEEPLALAWDADFQKCVHQYNPDIIVSGETKSAFPVEYLERSVPARSVKRSKQEAIGSKNRVLE